MAIDTLARGLAANTGGGGGGTTVDIEAGAGIRFDGTDPKTIINTGVVDVATPGNTGDDAQAEDGTLKISLPGSTGTTKKYVKPKGLNNAAFKDTDSTPTENSTKLVESGGVYSALGNKVDTSEKGAASGVATLDANGKLPTAQMPSHNHVGTEVTLTGYEKPSATDDIDPTDTVNQAIGKLEKALDGVLSDDTNYAGSNSPGGTATKAAALDVQAAVGSASKGVYINASGVPTEMTCSVETSVPQNAVFTDTTYTQGYGISIDENENNKITNTGVRSVDNSTGAEADGTFKVNENGTTKYIGIKGLNNAAFKSVDDSTAGISNTSTDNKVPTSKNVYDFVKGNSVTSVAAGAGLKTTPTTGTDGDPITTTGTVNLKLKSPTALSETAGNPDTSTDAVFPLAIDGAGNLATPVPMATTSAAGAVKIDTTLPADSSSISDNDVPTSKAVREAIEALPEPMVWKTGVTITADSTDTTKCSITIPASVGTVKEGYTFKITAIAQSPAYTGTLKVGDTLIADTENPTVTASWVLDTDWSVIPSGDEPSGTVTQVDAAPVTNSHLTAQITGGDAGGHLTETGTVTVGVESGYVIPPASSQQSASGGADLTLVTTGEKYIWDHKQDALTFDDSPTSGSNNPVKSGGVYTALNGKQDTISDLSTIRSGATAGATAVQPAELNDYVQNSSFVELADQVSTNQTNILSVSDRVTILENGNATVWGFKIKKNESDPTARVEYMYDAVGATGAFMDYANDKFDYGSWSDFPVIAHNRPVALNFDGSVAYELDHTDFSKKLDGSASDIEDSSKNYNFMSEIPLLYVKRWEDENYNYVAFSDKKINDDYRDDAFRNYNGELKPYIYLPMYKGSCINGKLRSLSKQLLQNNQDLVGGQAELNAAKALGDGWQLWDWSSYNYYWDILTLISKSCDFKTKFGYGATSRPSPQTNDKRELIPTGGYATYASTTALNNDFAAEYKGQFYGTAQATSTRKHVTALYVQDPWGNRWDRCLGLNVVNQKYTTKMSPPYTVDASGGNYKSWSDLTLPSSGQLKNVKSGEFAHLPIEVGGNSDQYYTCYYYTSGDTNTKLALVGGAVHYGSACGRFVYVDLVPSNSSWDIGASPCFK